MMADNGEQLGLATQVTVAWLSNPHTRAQAEDVEAMLGSVLTALRGLDDQASTSPAEPNNMLEYTPAVTVRKSLASPDHVISMIDGKPYRSLTRHLRSHGLTPDQYRERYGLKANYPMNAPSFSAARSAAAKGRQFGRKPTAHPTSDQPTATTTERQREADVNAVSSPTKRRRLSISSATQAAKAHLDGNKDNGARDSEAR